MLSARHQQGPTLAHIFKVWERGPLVSLSRAQHVVLTLLRVTQGTRIKPAQRGSGFATDAISAVAPPATSYSGSASGRNRCARLGTQKGA